MKSPWLLIDTNYLCYRAWYTTGSLTHGDLGTGVIYGVLRDIVTLQDSHNTDKLAFCFDFGKLLRAVDYPAYKANRGEKEAADEAFAAHFKVQVKMLRRQILKQIGYKNIFWQEGYEADDIIASICLNQQYRDREFIIVSADHDMYQLLGHNVRVWNPAKSKIVTEQSFSREYGISPLQWIDAKSIAGCSSDNITGIKGVGEKTACKFLNGSLKTDSVKFESIIKGNKLWKKNRHLIRLPYPGCQTPVLQNDKVVIESWQELCSSLGIRSLASKAPQAPKKKGFGFGQ